MANLIRKPIVWAIGALVLFGLVWWLVASLTGGKRARVEAELQGNRAEAGLESGRDAVDTVGEQGAAERAADDLTRRNADEIRAAEGADAPVADPAHAAGLRSLCRRAANRGRPECLQHAPAR